MERERGRRGVYDVAGVSLLERAVLCGALSRMREREHSRTGAGEGRWLPSGGCRVILVVTFCAAQLEAFVPCLPLTGAVSAPDISSRRAPSLTAL